MNYPCHLQQIPSLAPANSSPLLSPYLPGALPRSICPPKPGGEEACEGGQKPGQLHLWARLNQSQGESPPSPPSEQPAVKGAAFSWKHTLQKGICRAP